MNRTVIVGASAGGLATAEALRRAKYEGEITLVGDEVVYRKGDRLTGVLAAGASPRTLRAWRSLIAARTAWADALADTSAA